MKRKILLVFGVMMLVLLSGCSTLNGNVTVENKDLRAGDSTDIHLNLKYSNIIDSDKTEDLKIKILTGDHLQVLKDGRQIEEDILRNVSGDSNITYTLRADNWINSEQKVETVQFVVSSTDKTIKLTSDFILIKR